MDRYSAARVQFMVESAHRFGGDPLQDPGFHFENVNVEPCRFRDRGDLEADVAAANDAERTCFGKAVLMSSTSALVRR